MGRLSGRTLTWRKGSTRVPERRVGKQENGCHTNDISRDVLARKPSVWSAQPVQNNKANPLF